jgi:hypothetical protein
MCQLGIVPLRSNDCVVGLGSSARVKREHAVGLCEAPTYEMRSDRWEI